MPNPINLGDVSDLAKKSLKLQKLPQKNDEVKKEKETKIKIANFKKRKQRVMSEDGYSYM